METVVKWSGRYSGGKTASVTKTFLPTVEKAHSFLKKQALTPLLVQVFTGHGGFAEYLHRFKCKDSPGCVCDEGVAESIIHMLTECPQHSRAREDLQQQIQMNLCRDSIPAILEHPNSRGLFLAFCSMVARTAIERNRTR